MNIAIVGSRRFNDYLFMCDVMDRWQRFVGDVQVVSGGAPGADSMGALWGATYTNNNPIVHHAEWGDLSYPDASIKIGKDGKPYDVRAGFRRNERIVEDAEIVCAFMDPDNRTPGTSHTIKTALNAGKPVFIYWPGKTVQYE